MITKKLAEEVLTDMTYLTITPLKIVICLTLALLTAFGVRLAVGSARDRHFRRSQFKSVISIRGKIGDSLALGYPVTFKGLLIWLALIALIALECYAVLRFF